jgi:hypothetical protein
MNKQFEWLGKAHCIDIGLHTSRQHRHARGILEAERQRLLHLREIDHYLVLHAFSQLARGGRERVNGGRHSAPCLAKAGL